MTMPDEAHRAVVQTRRFLMDLLNPQKTPRVPAAVRLQARRLLKHYPFECEVSVSGSNIVKVKVSKRKKSRSSSEDAGLCCGGNYNTGEYPSWQLRRSMP
jgi:hypothetical protein